LKPDSRGYSVVYDKFKLQASIHSAALAMPRDDTPLAVRIDKGVRAARGGNETDKRLEATVTIPGRSSLKFTAAHMTIVDNAKYEPEQVLLINSSSPVAEKALSSKVTAYILPVRSPAQDQDDHRPWVWNDPTQVGADILAKSEPLKLNYVASDAPGDTAHGVSFSRRRAVIYM
jgi:hypothetical protein